MTMTSILDQTQPRLPFDVVGSIIDHLANEGDTNTLSACSYLSHDILHLTRRHLFRTFDMRKTTITGEEGILIKFYCLVSVSQHLVQYVQVVHILDLWEAHWVLDHPFLPRLLNLLTNVETFGLHVVAPALWNTLPPPLLSSMTDMVSRPSLTGLYLSGIEDIHPSFLNQCRFLEVLALDSVSLKNPPEPNTSTKEDDDEPTPPSAENKDDYRILLKFVSFSDCQNFLSRLNRLTTSQLLLDFSHLCDININFTPATFELTWKLIHSARPTLETLKLSQKYSHANEFNFVTPLCSSLDSHRQLLPHVTLTQMNQLQNLSLTILIQSLRDPPPREIVGEWCLLLQTAPRGIKNLTITLDLFFLDPVGVSGLFSNRQGNIKNLTLLTELDETLFDAQRFPCLSEVVVELQLPEDHENSSDSEYADYGADNGDPQEQSLTFDDFNRSVERMMKLTRKRLGKTASGAETFRIQVGIGC